MTRKDKDWRNEKNLFSFFYEIGIPRRKLTWDFITRNLIGDTFFVSCRIGATIFESVDLVTSENDNRQPRRREIGRICEWCGSQLLPCSSHESIGIERRLLLASLQNDDLDSRDGASASDSRFRWHESSALSSVLVNIVRRVTSITWAESAHPSRPIGRRRRSFLPSMLEGKLLIWLGSMAARYRAKKTPPWTKAIVLLAGRRRRRCARFLWRVLKYMRNHANLRRYDIVNSSETSERADYIYEIYSALQFFFFFYK